ncbi:glycosyltransferase [Nanoarchaeota archaeon]
MKVEKNPFVSIVVCAYNAEIKIRPTIRSLLNQDYPKDKYEIIVVDDYSKDKTTEIVEEYPVKLIKHKLNKGLSGARNTGLKNSKGNIYVGFDDDCIAEKNWLSELVKIYQEKEDIGGVAGLILEKPKSNITEKFIQEQGCGNPLPKYFQGQKNIFSRFANYIKSKLNPLNQNSSEKFLEVGTMSGANSSFPTDILKKVQGWDENLSGTEDIDLIARIRKKNSKLKFYVNTNANLIHDHKLKFKQYILRPWKRRKVIVKSYLDEGKTLPLFPFPIAFIIWLLISLFFGLRIFILSIFLAPQILYFWFPLKFIKSFKVRYLIFSYMNVISEMVTLLGILMGYIEIKNEKTKN